MNTEKAYRDLGKAIVKAFIDSNRNYGMTKISVFVDIIALGAYFCIEGEQQPVVSFNVNELEKVRAAKEYIENRKEKEEE